MKMWDLCRAVVIAGFICPSPIVWAQALEVADVDTTRAAVETQVEKLVTELATKDPELAKELEHQKDLCVRDLSDGRLESPEFTKEIETYRDVQRDLAERVVKGEMEGRIADAMAKGNRELAESMRTAFETFQGAGGGETMNRDDAKKIFEKAYQETLTRDPEGAQHMKEMFESAERGEFVRPTPEMMERMGKEMGEYLRENPEMREYAHVEWDRMTERGVEQGHEMMEHGMEMDRQASERMAHEGFEHWAEGRDASEVEHAKAEMERYFERDNSAILDNRAEFLQNSPAPGGGGGGTPPSPADVERLPDRDHFADHDGDTVPEHHPHEIWRHSDGTCHDHTTGTATNC